MSQHRLAAPLVDLVAQRLRVVGEPMRIRLLERLRDGDASVNELAAELDAPRQNVSKHLDKLHRLHIVERRKAGNHVVYHLADPSALELVDLATTGVSAQLATMAALAPGAREQATLRDRAQASTHTDDRRVPQ
jgi:DNA-binding transcriptional ArsR family regulator